MNEILHLTVPNFSTVLIFIFSCAKFDYCVKWLDRIIHLFRVNYEVLLLIFFYGYINGHHLGKLCCFSFA